MTVPVRRDWREPFRSVSWLFAMLCAASVAAVPAVAQEPSAADGGFSTALAGPAELSVRLERILADPALARAHVGLVAQVAETGEILFETAGEKLFIPASNTKIVTAAGALHLLGPGHRWRTVLRAAGSIRDGVLDGNLWIVGGGDPLLEAAQVDSWPDLISAAGIRRITGDVIGDDRVFTAPAWGLGWFWHELHAAWAAGITGLQIHPSTVRARLVPAVEIGGTAKLERIDDGPPLRLEADVKTGDPGSEIRLRYEPPPEGGRVRLAGWIPGRDTVPLSLATHHPTLYLLEYLGERLTAAGIRVDGRLRRAAADERPSEASWEHEVVSDSLGNVIAEMLKPSDNQVAESVLRTVGVEAGDEGSPEEGLAAVAGVLRAWGIEPGAMELADGSGLSRYNRIAPHAMARLLRTMWRHEHFDVFLAAMPVAAVDGTMRRRLGGTPAEENVRAKTGSLSSARALSGYLSDGSGETLVFSLMVNGYDVPGDVAVALEDLLVEQLALYRRPVVPGWPSYREDPQ